MERERSPEQIREAAIADVQSKISAIMASPDHRDEFYRAMYRFAHDQKTKKPETVRSAFYHALIGSSEWRDIGATPTLDLAGEPIRKFVDDWYERVQQETNQGDG